MIHGDSRVPICRLKILCKNPPRLRHESSKMSRESCVLASTSHWDQSALGVRRVHPYLGAGRFGSQW